VMATLLDRSATVAGLMAAAIAVGGFLAHAVPALAGWDEKTLRQITVIGGLWGVGGAIAVVVCLQSLTRTMTRIQIKAVAFTFVGLTALTVVTCFVLGALGADGTAWGLATMILAGFGGFVLSLVMMHFTPPDERRR